MLQVWFLFKGLQTLIGCTCIIYHIVGFLNKEPSPHIMLFCGTSFGFTLLSSMTMIAIAVGGAPPIFVECLINFTASIMYILTSIVSMYYAENDFHLMYLSDFEEPLHTYFAFCRSQSVAALAAGTLHMLHAILATDALIIKKPSTESSEESSSSDSDEEDEAADVKRPIRLFFLSKFIEKRLRRNNWFDKMCQRKSPTLSLFSFGRSRESDLMAMTRFNSDDNDKMAGAKSTTVMKKKSSKKRIAKPANVIPPVQNRRVDSDTEDEKVLNQQDLAASSVNTVNERSKNGKDTSFLSDQSALGGMSTRFRLPSSQESSADVHPSFKPEKTDPQPSILRKPEKQTSNTPSNQSNLSTQEPNMHKSVIIKSEEKETPEDQTEDLQSTKMEPSSKTEQIDSSDGVEETVVPQNNEPSTSASQNETPTGSSDPDEKKDLKDKPPPQKPSSD